jgi:ferritin-like metal-binding protein YciE
MNFFGTVAKDLVWFAKKVRTGIITAASDAPTILSDIQKNEAVIEGITAAVAPGAAAVEQTAFSALGVIAQGVEDAGSAATANGLSLTLDQKIIADVKAILPFLKSHASKNAIAPAPVLPPPAPVK